MTICLPAGWRWLFVLEGAPAVLLGFAIWAFLPASVPKCRFLTPEEQQHLQAAISGTIPPTGTCGKQALCNQPQGSSVEQQATTTVKAVTHPDSPTGSTCSSSSNGSYCGGNDGSKNTGGKDTVIKSKEQTEHAGLPAASEDAAVAGSGSSTEAVFAAGMKACNQEGLPSRQQLLADLVAAAACRVVWCASGWRFLYLLTLNGLVYW